MCHFAIRPICRCSQGDSGPEPRGAVPPHRYVGADRLSDANQLSGGVTARLIDTASGQQFLSATLGETWYFESPRVLLPDEVPSNRQYSNFVGELELSAYRHWNMRLGVEWNPEATQSEKGQISLQYKPAAQSVVNLGSGTGAT